MGKREGLYTLTAVSRLTGLTPDTLRAWERRHAVVAPVRSDSGRRMYSGEDVQRLRLLSNAVRNGHSIGSLAVLDDGALSGLLEHAESIRVKNDATFGEPLKIVLDAVERYDADACERTIGTALATMPVDTVIDDLIFPALVETGARWQSGAFTIGQERILSTVVRRLALNMLSTLSRAIGKPRVLLGSPSGEGHELGALLAAVDAAASGVGCSFVGADLPGAEFARIAERLGVEVIALSVVLNPPPTAIAEELRGLQAQLTKPLGIWLGGAGAPALMRTVADVPAEHVADFSAFRERVRALRYPNGGSARSDLV